MWDGSLDKRAAHSRATKIPLSDAPSVGREFTNQFYAFYADIRQRGLTRLCRENASVVPQEILHCIQKLQDRVLFCAFCKDRRAKWRRQTRTPPSSRSLK